MENDLLLVQRSANFLKPFLKNTSRVTVLAVALLLSKGESAFGDWVKPYSNGSVTDNIIKFQNGPDGYVMSPNPAYTEGLGYSSAQASGLGGGWALTAAGSVAFGTGIPPDETVVGRSNAYTEVFNSGVAFETESSDIFNLEEVSFPMRWSASSVITGSDIWDAQGSTSYAYQATFLLNQFFVSGAEDFYNGITLTIKAGANTIYQTSGLAEILGISSITEDRYDNALLYFTYDQADGPLEIIWSAETLMDGDLLAIARDGRCSLFYVSGSAILVEPIPEPSLGCILATGAIALVAMQRIRRFESSKG